jgi:hypothetical protein
LIGRTNSKYDTVIGNPTFLLKPNPNPILEEVSTCGQYQILLEQSFESKTEFETTT